jgi:hypothetical protein
MGQYEVKNRNDGKKDKELDRIEKHGVSQGFALRVQ